ncbi:MAG TPA: TonB-dependent receptor [Pseudomonadales bacterium]|nr:TonB-dependent receptor [Pseudomonadales bacterium]
MAAEANDAMLEEVVVVGSRVAGRVATDAPVPVDVFTSDDLENQGATDMDDMLRNLIPSYNVQRAAISDAATITRPATMRGLPPDNVLVLVNGKRRHRAAVIAELGGSLAAGSQGPDLSVIPPLAIQQVQVLRDGAAAQYGSDAIAGVINYVLKENREGLTFEGRYGEYSEGDGESMLLGANIGLPLGPNGFASITGQWKDNEATSRSLQRTDAAALIATGNTNVRNPAQIWGQPEVADDYAFFLNSGIELTDSQEVYAFGNYAEREVTGGFFFRNPNNRSGVFTGDGIRAIMDTNLAGQTGQTSNCPALASPGGTPTDQALVDADNAAVAALPANCFLFNTQFPGGFTPAFGGKVEDASAVVGIRGTSESLAPGLAYDFSASLGRNETEFNISNTLNPSLGPDSPTSFNLGKYVQIEQNYNMDFSYPVQVDAFASDLNVAFGAEYRVETFEIRLGEQAAWDSGDYAFQGANFYSDGVTPMVPMSIGANGFAGFGPTQVGEFDRSNYAAYIDLEADVTERLLIGIAGRFEDFEDFGTTTNGKIAAHFKVTDDFSVRGSASTGFRAPTPGQSNVTKVSTITVDGILQQRGQIPPTNPIAGFLGAEALDAEEATNFTLGAAWDVTDALTVTLDFYRIELQDRITQTGTIDITGQPVPAGVGCTAASTNLAECLQELGIPGAADLSSVSFFTNDFDTTTQGIDLVATYDHDWGDYGLTNFQAAWNYTETEVDDIGTEVSRNRLSDLENFNPENRGIFTVNHTVGPVRLLVRASYYDEYVDGDFSGDPTFTAGSTNYSTDCTLGNDNCYDEEWVMDLEAAYTFQDRYSFIVGGQNVFDNNGAADKDNLTGTIGSGNEYATSSPFGFDGAFWYARFRVDLD